MKSWGWLLVGLLVACSAPVTSVRVEWTTASEVETAGFNLYRGDSPAGPFVQINTSLIPASPDPILGGKYKYEDTSVIAGQTYYYQLEEVERTGKTTRYGPIVITAPVPWYADVRLWIVGGLALVVFVGVAWRMRR